MAQCCYINDNTWVSLSPHLFAGTPMLNALTFSVNDTHVVIMWTFNDMGVPLISFNVTINCGDQPIVNNIPAPMTGNQVIITQELTSYPAATSCTVTVGTSNLLGLSTTLTNTFTTSTDSEGKHHNWKCAQYKVQFEIIPDEYWDANVPDSKWSISSDKPTVTTCS